MDYLNLKNVSDISDAQLTNQVSANLVMWLDWAFLNIGAFYNAPLDVSGVYGGSPCRLRPVDEPYYTDGQVWEGARSNWVYETGITYSYNPINISGVYINNSFVVSGYTVDFPKGRIVFDSAVSTTGVVQCEHSFKYIKIMDADQPIAQNLMFDSMRFDNSQFLQQGSGMWDTLSQSRIQLPAIIVDPTSRIRNTPLELGGGSYRHQDVILYVVAETPSERNNIADILLNQKDKTIFLFNLNQVAESGFLPLDYDGSRAPNGLQYPDLVREDNPYRLRRCLINETVSDTFDDPYRGLYRSVIQWSLKITVPAG